MTEQQVSMSVLTAWSEDLRKWMETSAAKGRGNKTISAYLSDLGNYAGWFERTNGQAFEPGLITSIDLRAYRDYSLGTQRVKPATWNRRRIALATMCQWARVAGFLSYDPFQGVAAADEEELPPRWLTKADFNRVMRQVERNVNAAKTEFGRRAALRDQAMVTLMAYAGLREGELVALDADDLVITPRGGKVIVRMGKGQKRREIPLGAEARRAVSAWLSVARVEGSEPVFMGKRSDRLTTRQVQRVVAEIGRQAGIDLTPHMLRHTFAKRLVDNGSPLTVAQKLLGHSRLDTTSRYVKPGWDDLARAVESL